MAEKVTQSAQLRDGLPEIEPVKLSHKTAHSRRGLTSEQEASRHAAPSLMFDCRGRTACAAARAGKPALHAAHGQGHHLSSGMSSDACRPLLCGVRHHAARLPSQPACWLPSWQTVWQVWPKLA